MENSQATSESYILVISTKQIFSSAKPEKVKSVNFNPVSAIQEEASSDIKKRSKLGKLGQLFSLKNKHKKIVEQEVSGKYRYES